MIAAGMVGLALGYLAGLRFCVLVLLPLELAAVAAGVSAVLSGAMVGLAAFAAFVAFSAGLQVSYVAALALPLPGRRVVARAAEV